MLPFARWCRTSSNEATPLSSQATASPSMMHERARKPGQRFDDQREAAGEVVARSRIEPHARTILAGNDAEAVVFNFVQPLTARWQFVGFCRKARRDEPGGQGTLQHVD